MSTAEPKPAAPDESVALMLHTGGPATTEPSEEAEWPDRRLLKLLGIELPLVLAPMAGLGTVALAASVCDAGGLGSIGCAAMTPEIALNEITYLRTRTSQPINANFFCHVPQPPDAARDKAWRDRLARYFQELGLDPATPLPRTDFPPFDDAMCAIVEQTRPEVVSFHFGLPLPALVDRVKAAGCRVMSTATTVSEALWLEAHGADVVIAQGLEAGGHRGMFLGSDFSDEAASQQSTLALVPQIADAVAVPVIAAGGIADGRGIAAVFALGAAGAQIGTAYLRCPEAATPLPYREALRLAGSDATVVTNVFTGRPARALSNRFTREVGPMAKDVPLFPTAMAASGSLRAEAERNGSSDFSAFWAGQGASLGRDMEAKPFTEMLATQALARFRQLATRLNTPELLDQAVTVASTFTPMSAGEMADLMSRTRQLGITGQSQEMKVSFHFDSTHTHPEWLGPEGEAGLVPGQ